MSLGMSRRATTTGRGTTIGGVGMLRAAAWVGSLFAVGAGVLHFFPVGAWAEPLVLATLGAGLFLAGGRQEAKARDQSAEPSKTGLPMAERAAR